MNSEVSGGTKVSLGREWRSKGLFWLVSKIMGFFQKPVEVSTDVKRSAEIEMMKRRRLYVRPPIWNTDRKGERNDEYR